jgi:S1-C subfamily serine protease
MRAAVGLEPRDGLLVRGVLDGSPAATAGIQRGDLIIAAGDTPLTTADDLFEVLDATTGSLTLRVLRGTDEREIPVRFSS